MVRKPKVEALEPVENNIVRYLLRGGVTPNTAQNLASRHNAMNR